MAVFQAGKYVFPLGERTYVMGILNVTPDSFSDGGRFFSPQAAVSRVLAMQKEGADIIDIGAQSTRPGHTPISWQEEWNRLEPVLLELRDKLSLPISVDTYYPEVAMRALEEGADIINDVKGFCEDMWQVAASNKTCGCILMHGADLQPRQDAPKEVCRYFIEKQRQAASYGIENSLLCMDPGVGFGKSMLQNLQLLHRAAETKLPGVAFLMAASRKRVIGAPCGNPPFEERMPGTIAAHTIAQAGGADFLRVHDVKEAVQAAKVADAVIRERLPAEWGESFGYH